MNRTPFAPDEWYHCYTRGVDKRKVFESDADYNRFLQLLYVCNSRTPIHRSNFVGATPEHIFSVERGEPLVSVGAYSLMPNHFHLLLKDLSESGDGVSKFMQKLGTSYTMYFNKRRDRVGNLFVKPFRSKHVHDDSYLGRIAQYIHFNPIELFEPGWKQGSVRSTRAIERRLNEYEFSSLPDYSREGKARPQKVILDEEIMEFLEDGRPSLAESLDEMREYYASLSNVKVTP